jgi:uncharacterized protein (TIGR03067 family)
MMRSHSLLAALALAAGGQPSPGTASSPKEDAVKAELKALRGCWKLESQEFDGKKVSMRAVKNQPYKLTLVAGTYRFDYEDQDDTEAGKFTIDVSKTPRTMDLSIGATIGSADLKGKKRLLLYELDGDQLKIASLDGLNGLLADKPGNKRPMGFSGKGVSLFVYTREK